MSRPAHFYGRVSTGRQARNGVSLPQQLERFGAWLSFTANEQGAGPFSDPGLSGKRFENRKGLQDALDATCRTKGILVVYSLSRLGRSVPDLYAVTKRLEKAGADLVSLTEPIDTTTAMGKAFFGFLAVVAQLGSDLTSEHVRGILRWKRASKLKYGEIPWGYRVVPDPACPKHTIDPERACSCALVSDDVEQDTLATIRALRLTRKWPEIAAELNRQGIRTKKNRAWTPQNVRKTAMLGRT